MAGHDTTHQCPGPGCRRSVPGYMLMCSTHWYQVPVQLRSAVWAAWNRGAGAGSMEHMQAIAAAVEAVQ